ncbi:MAG: SDR family oxidoreductase [Verrucomicrobiota bacterium]
MEGDNIIQFSTEKKTVLITGCTRGLGRAMTEAFVARGDTVVGCGRSEEELTKIREKLGESPHRFFQIDITEDTSVEILCEQTVDQVGIPNLILNNAGVINEGGPLWEISDDEFTEVMEVNVKGTASVIRHMVPHMIDSGNSGVIVNFSSGWGRSTSPEVAPYCASKWAIEGLTQALAQELPPHLGTVALNPGIIDTELLRTCFGPSSANYTNPKDWARTAVPFLVNLAPTDNGKSLTAP